MDFNGIENNYSSYQAASVSAKTVTSSKASVTADSDGKISSSASASAYSEVSATYEASDKTVSSVSSKDRKAVIAQLKADTEQRMAQMQSLVTKMFQKQGITIGTADDMWKILASGKFTADADTIAQAKEDISEDGYWGVNQTSDRLIDFAIALSGGDADKMEEMVKAVDKGFKLATKSWGSELPSISQDTYSATMNKFDAWFEQNGSSAKTSDILGTSN